MLKWRALTSLRISITSFHFLVFVLLHIVMWFRYYLTFQDYLINKTLH